MEGRALRSISTRVLAAAGSHLAHCPQSQAVAARIFEGVALGLQALPPGVSGASRFVFGKSGSDFYFRREKEEESMRGASPSSALGALPPGGGTGPKGSRLKGGTNPDFIFTF